MGKNIYDNKSGDKIGQFVFTLHIIEEKKAMEILDLDITLSGTQTVDLRLLELLPGSSASNEYFDAETVDNEQPLQVETVNRHLIEGDILDSVRTVRASAFPFALNIFDDINAFNVWVGFKNEIALKGTDIKVDGLSSRFIAPGSFISQDGTDDETYSFVVGTVTDYRDVSITVGDMQLFFILAQLDTALGILPTAMSREVFDLEKLAVGKIIAMQADIKADLAI